MKRKIDISDQPKWVKKLLSFSIFACFGITAEIFFTAFVEYFTGNGSLRLMGQSYVWMFFIYGSAAIFLPLFMPKIEKFNLIVRLLIYALGIFIIEFITGFLLDVTIGRCPWEYQTGWHIMGYIRLDYTPAWMFFGFFMEKIFFLNRGFGLED